jgi:hypothetical protein
MWIQRTVGATCLLFFVTGIQADENARSVVQQAIKAHGGEANLKKTLRGSLRGKVTADPTPAVHSDADFEETFELPTRYRRNVKGEGNGMKFSMEYAVTDGQGWLRQGDRNPIDFKVPKLPIERHWNTMTLPGLLEAKYKLSMVDKVETEAGIAIGIRIESEQANSVLYFHESKGLLLKARKVMHLPLMSKEGEVEVIYSDYKQVDKIMFPMKLTSMVEGKKIIEVTLTETKFLDKVDDRVFDKP